MGGLRNKGLIAFAPNHVSRYCTQRTIAVVLVPYLINFSRSCIFYIELNIMQSMATMSQSKLILALLTIVAMFATTINGYPSLFIAKYAKSCTDVPAIGVRLGAHGATMPARYLPLDN